MQNFVGKTKCIVGYMKVADEDLNGQRGLSVKISLLSRLSVKIFDLCRLLVNQS